MSGTHFIGARVFFYSKRLHFECKINLTPVKSPKELSGLTRETIYLSFVLVRQDLTIRPAMCWWLWSSSPLTSLKAFTWIERRRMWELVTRFGFIHCYMIHSWVAGVRRAATVRAHDVILFAARFTGSDVWICHG